ncbi:CLUMA_CG006364, isoform A [Clunio marinus]|uniref:CLUMA_CG006364, isoform A n=1 Tax=Clunio marinus TaxID=568069 RepID=A0A1J1HXS5_9DIPT|nr:CLUMA_CG006364, isoform A [Clunio marinus]
MNYLLKSYEQPFNEVKGPTTFNTFVSKPDAHLASHCNSVVNHDNKRLDFDCTFFLCNLNALHLWFNTQNAVFRVLIPADEQRNIKPCHSFGGQFKKYFGINRKQAASQNMKFSSYY